MKISKSLIFCLLVSVLPLIDIFLNPGLPHTSDGAMHLARFAAYYKEFTGGQFPVRWASQFNYGYGTPIFNFFHPLPYLIGIPLLAAKLSLVNTLKVSFALSYILAGLFCFLFAKAFFKDAKIAVLVTVFYQFAPFRLVEMLVRGSLGGLYSYTLLPLVLYSAVMLGNTKKYAYFLLLAVSTALLSMSHNIIGLVFFGISFLFVIFFSANRKHRIQSLVGLSGGLFLAAFFLIPAIIEHKYTYGYLLTKDLFYDHFAPLKNFFIPDIFNTPSLRTAEVSVQIGLFNVVAFLASGYAVFFRKNSRFRKIYIFTFILTLVTIFFMTSGSKYLWENIPVLRQFQYPWRLLAAVCFLTAFASVSLTDFGLLKHRTLFWLVIALTILSSSAYWAPYQGYQKISEKYYWNYPLSTNYFGEVNSIWMGNEPSAYPQKRIEVISGSALVGQTNLAAEDHKFTITAESESTVLDRTEFFPGWKVFVNGTAVPIQFQDQNHRGLITFGVPAGTNRVEVKFTQDGLQIASDYLSLLAVTLLGLGLLLSAKNTNQLRRLGFS